MGRMGVIKMDILERQSRLIETQRTLFINTVEQFKKDLIFLQGCVAISSVEQKSSGDLSNESLMFILNHIGEMQSMLNDFEARMASYE